MICPVCDTKLASSDLEECPVCHKNLRHDITIVPSLGKLPKDVEKRYLKWIKIYQNIF